MRRHAMQRFGAGIVMALGMVALAHASNVQRVHVGHLIDVRAERVLQDQVIDIRDGRIHAIRDYDAERDAGSATLDWSRYTVTPGLIDLHTHLIGDIQSANLAAPLLSSASRDTLLGVKNARATLFAGFTTVRDVGAYRAFTDVALRDAIAAGDVPGPRMFVAAAYITVSQGGGEVTGLAPDVEVPAEMRRGVADTADQVRQRVRELIARGADVIKVIATGAVLTAGTEPGASEYSEAELKAAVDEAALHGRFVATHAHGSEGIKRAIRAGVRTVEHASYLDDEAIALMKEHGTWLVADIYNGDYISEVGARDGWPEEILRKNRETTQTQRDGFVKAVQAGVNIAFGTDAGIFPHGDNARQLAYAVRYGLTPMQALRSASYDSARALGRETEFGALEVGLAADMVAVEGDPLATIDRMRDVQAVMKDGIVQCQQASAIPCRTTSP
ncbi:MAG: imidazolonepropionase [Alphaproteobacteria bacterium ADurb.BinA280]|jgi:imidazolonepropionase-like amidohydrolase|nr:MAG: imidazolonepropionase [Alphaproteobacteria bacterium ADurb.BinA280]